MVSEERLQRALPANTAGQQEIKPDQAGIVGLDGQAERQAQDAGGHKAVLKKAPDGHDA